MNVDFIIVGQGIAGSVLSYTLLKRGCRVLVVDNDHASSSSKVAAGLFNPIVFKRLVPSWKADELLPYADEFYINLEKKLETKFYYRRNIIKLFASQEEKEFWKKKAELPEIRVYLGEVKETDVYSDMIHNPYGLGIVNRAGNVEVTEFLSAVKEYLVTNNSFLPDNFNEADVSFEEEKVKWKNFSARKVILCQGAGALNSKYFQWLPFVLTKGEILTVRIPGYKIQDVVNKGVFILPVKEDVYKVGATYNWKDLDAIPSITGKEELLEKLNKVLKLPFEVLSHEAGVRPTVKDRRPLIGLHPKFKQLAVFNGMGTKAVMLAPFFATQFADFLEGIASLDDEVNISRYYSCLPDNS